MFALISRPVTERPMRDAFLAFLEDPSPERFRDLRGRVVRHPDYNPYGGDLDRLEEAYDAGLYAEVGERFAGSTVNLLMSPRAHMVLSLAARNLGNEEGFEAEKFISFRCLDGILGTGDGTRSHPYAITRLSDEYDVLMMLDRTLEQQQLIHGDDGRSYDVLTSTDGSEYWFDITDVFAALEKRKGEDGVQ